MFLLTLGFLIEKAIYSQQANHLCFLQDVIFGSEGTAQADFERMEEINHEIGLTQMLRGSSPHGAGSDVGDVEKEKIGEHAESLH